MIFQKKLLGAETDDLEPRSVLIRAEMGGAEIIMSITTCEFCLLSSFGILVDHVHERSLHQLFWSGDRSLIETR